MRDQVIETSPREDIFWEIFLCYRMVGKRPIVEMLYDAEKGIKGEVLKVSWGIEPGVLLCDLDNPQNTTWVPMVSVKAIRFLNPGILPECGMLDHKTRELLNLIHPGYGDEVEEKYRKNLKN